MIQYAHDILVDNITFADVAAAILHNSNDDILVKKHITKKNNEEQLSWISIETYSCELFYIDFYTEMIEIVNFNNSRRFEISTTHYNTIYKPLITNDNTFQLSLLLCTEIYNIVLLVYELELTYELYNNKKK